MMDNPEQQELSPTEKQFCDKQTLKIIKDQEGAIFSVHQGLPRESYAGKGVFVPPDMPHIFTAQNFRLIAPGQTLVDTANVNVLFMHGVTKDGRWYPENQELQQKKLSVENIVQGLAKTGQSVDAIFVCNPKHTSRVKIVPFSEQYQTPMIYMKQGDAHGGVTINETTGDITVEMTVNSPAEVEYLKWKNKGRVRIVK